MTRTTRSVSPTDAGGQLLAQLRPALSDIRGVLTTLSGLQSTPVGRIRLSVPRLAAKTVVGPARDQAARMSQLRNRPGSLQVKAGDRVRRGQVLARIGNSGDSREPHLHFEVTTSSTLLAGEGVPYVIDHFQLRTAGNSWQARTRELPLADMVIDFGQRHN